MHTKGGIHGLAEIQFFAQKFVTEENKKNNANLLALEPDLRSQVPECAVPLRGKWIASKYYRFYERVVLVYCIKTITNKYGEDKWNIEVPIYDPTIEAIFSIYEIADNFIKKENLNRRKKLKSEPLISSFFWPKCEVPLTADWSKISKTTFPNVTVTCSKANRKNDTRKQWHIEIKTSEK
jgi:hypothetical protein